MVSGSMLSDSTDQKILRGVILINQGKTLRTLDPWRLGGSKRQKIGPVKENC